MRTASIVLVCSWILWSSGPVGTLWLLTPVDSFESLNQCKVAQEVALKTRTSKAIDYVCLPDTVNPNTKQ